MSGDTDGSRFTRRAVLAAVSTVGTVGALTGHGAAAYLSDRETLGTNGVTAGAVTLSLDGADTGRTSLSFALDAYGYEQRDERTVCLGLDADSNPGWVWVRACPPETALTGALAARLRVDATTVFSGTLAGLLALLSGDEEGGVLLSSDGDPVRSGGETAGAEPIAPGDAVCLSIAVWAPTSLSADPDTVGALRDASPLAVSLDVYAEQSRHVPIPRRPVEGSNPSFAFPTCEAEEDDLSRSHAISNVSLCTDGPVDGSEIDWIVRDPSTLADLTGVVDEPFVVDVMAPVPIDHAVVKAGSASSPDGGFRRFDAGGATTVRVTSTGGTRLAVSNDFARCACPDRGVKLDWNDDRGDFDPPESLSCGGGEPTPGGDAPSTEPTDDEPEQPGNRGGDAAKRS
jgi:hypothetical protein